MVALTPSLIDVLGDLAVDVREGFEAEAGSVSKALSLNAAFTENNVPRSALERSIIVREFLASAGRHGLNPRPGLGGAVELYEPLAQDYAIIRLRSAEIVAGELRVIASSGSTWGGLSEEGLWRDFPYVFGYVVGDDDTLEFFVAEVTGQTKTAVAHLEFGWTHHFTTPSTPPGEAFEPNEEESLDGWDRPQVAAVSEQV